MWPLLNCKCFFDTTQTYEFNKNLDNYKAIPMFIIYGEIPVLQLKNIILTCYFLVSRRARIGAPSTLSKYSHHKPKGMLRLKPNINIE